MSVECFAAFLTLLYQISAIVTRGRFPNQFCSDSLVANDGGSSWLFQYSCAGTSRHHNCAVLRGRRRMARKLGGFLLLQRSMTVQLAPTRRRPVASAFTSF